MAEARTLVGRNGACLIDDGARNLPATQAEPSSRPLLLVKKGSCRRSWR